MGMKVLESSGGRNAGFFERHVTLLVPEKILTSS